MRSVSRSRLMTVGLGLGLSEGSSAACFSNRVH